MHLPKSAGAGKPAASPTALQVKPRLWKKVGLATLGVAVLVGAGYFLWPAPKITRVLHIGFQNAAPYHFPDANGKPTGPVVDMLRAAAQRRNIRLEWVYFPAGPEKALASGQMDLWPLMGDLPERRKILYISQPWARETFNMVLPASVELRQPEDLGQRTLAVATSVSLDARMARKYFSDAKIVSVAD